MALTHFSVGDIIRVTDMNNIIDEVNEKVDVENSAAAHNCLYRGKDLTNVYTLDALSSKIQANDWTDLFIGDYIDMTMTSTVGGTEKVRWMFAGFDYYMNRGDTAFTQHHIVMIPEDAFQTLHQMNSSDTTNGGYQSSAMRGTVLPSYENAISASSAFGSHVATFRELRSNTMNSSIASGAGAGWMGASTDWAWYDSRLMLLSEAMVYGCRVLSSSLYDVGAKNQQLPLFRLAPDRLVCGYGFQKSQSSRYNWWLSGVALADSFCFVSYYGDSLGYLASHSFGVRPAFLFV